MINEVYLKEILLPLALRALKRFLLGKIKFFIVYLIMVILLSSRGEGEVTLRWIPRPEKRRNQMARIVGIDLQANQNPH